MHYITTEMDEIEREEFFRIKRTQQKKIIRAQKAAAAKKINEQILNGDTTPVETEDEKILNGDATPVNIVDEILDEVDKISEADEIQNAAGEQYRYSVESPTSSKEHFIITPNLTKRSAYQDQDSNKDCGVCCSETLEELKRKIEVLMNKMNENIPCDDGIDKSILCDICNAEVPQNPKQEHIDFATQINSDFSEGVYSGDANIQTEDTGNCNKAEKETPVVKIAKPSETCQKQSLSNDGLSSLPSITKISKSDSPLIESSLGYVKKVFKETVKIKRLPNRSGQICEDKEIITVRSEIKKYRASQESDTDDISTISGESTEAGPSNKTKYCRLCEDDANDKNARSDDHNKCKDKRVQYSDQTDTSQTKCKIEPLYHITLPRQSPILERNSDAYKLPIVQEDVTNTSSSGAISKNEDTQNSCNILSLINDTESKNESDSIFSEIVAQSGIIYNHQTEPFEIENNRNHNEDEGQKMPSIKENKIELKYRECNNNNEELPKNCNESITEPNTLYDTKEQQHIAKTIEFIDLKDNQQETPTTCHTDTNSRQNEINLIEPNCVRSKVEFNNKIDIKRSFDTPVQIILTKSIARNDNSTMLFDGSDNACIPSATAQATDLENVEQLPVVSNLIGSETSQDKISSDSQSITHSPKWCSDQCLACGYRQYQSSQGTDILSPVWTESIFEGTKTKSESINTEYRDVKLQSSPDAGLLHRNSFTNCRGLLNTFKGYLTGVWQQTKTVNRDIIKDCIYYQTYYSKDIIEEKEGSIQDEMSVVDVKVNCPLCKKKDEEGSNYMIKKLFENIQHTLKRNFVNKNVYSQTSMTNFDLSSKCSNFSRRKSNSSSSKCIF